MYNIIQLNDKDLSELQTIARELGIKKTDSLKKEELVYKILDEQAIAGATKKVAADKLKEERNEDKKKRSRVAMKKENKVFSATKNGEITKTETAVPVPAPAAKVQPKEAEPVKAEVAPATEKTAATPKKKVGRPRKNAVENKPKEEQVAPVAAAETEKPVEVKKAEVKKIETKPISKPIIKPKAPAVIDEESNILSESADDDFIPIEDLPSEKVELPTELFGKFESTKTEPAVTPVPEQTQNQQRPRVIRPRDNNNNSNNNNNNNNNAPRNNNPRLPMQRPVQQQNTGENAPAPERKVIEREKPYEFDDILTGTGVLEIMQAVLSFMLRRMQS